jgi:SH3-like domain-containing protein
LRNDRNLREIGHWNRLRRLAIASLLGCVALAGCARFKPLPVDHYVYVTTKEANLRDRVAAVSNRTGQVVNGDKLKVLDHARHWVKVQTAKGQIGWIEEKAVLTEEQAGEFEKLGEDHKADVNVASGVVRDQVYMHIKPGRDTERFYLLNEGDKLQLLRKATLEKATTGAGAAARSQKAIPQAAGTDASKKDAAGAPAAAVAAAIATGKGDAAPAIAPPAMEDWWLARDSAGHTGWLYSRRVDVDAPDALTRYAEGQKFIGAYVLTTIHDDDAPGDVKDVPIYLTVLAPYKAGLPYDFDQVRVFTWSTKMHRYETAFREKNIEGYFPVGLKKMKDPNGKSAMAQELLPSFTFRVLAADSPAPEPDPETGEVKPAKTITKTYRLENTIVKRIASGPGALTTEMEAHPAPEEKKDKKGKKK